MFTLLRLFRNVLPQLSSSLGFCLYGLERDPLSARWLQFLLGCPPASPVRAGLAKLTQILLTQILMSRFKSQRPGLKAASGVALTIAISEGLTRD